MNGVEIAQAIAENAERLVAHEKRRIADAEAGLRHAETRAQMLRDQLAALRVQMERVL